MAKHIGLMPGTQFPSVEVSKVGGGTLVTRPADGRYLLIVVYRGSFCPFCRASLTHLISKKAELEAANIDVILLSADLKEHAEPFAKEMALPFPTGFGLTEAQMAELGTFISDPKDYQIHFTHRFSEPAWFFVRPDGVVKYIDVASMPMGGRVHVDDLLAGHNWVLQESKDRPEFEKVVWGSVV